MKIVSFSRKTNLIISAVLVSFGQIFKMDTTPLHLKIKRALDLIC